MLRLFHINVPFSETTGSKISQIFPVMSQVSPYHSAGMCCIWSVTHHNGTIAHPHQHVVCNSLSPWIPPSLSSIVGLATFKEPNISLPYHWWYPELLRCVLDYFSQYWMYLQFVLPRPAPCTFQSTVCFPVHVSFRKCLLAAPICCRQLSIDFHTESNPYEEAIMCLR